MPKGRKNRQRTAAEFASVAAQFCRLIESHRKIPQQGFLRQVAIVLPRLYASALELPPVKSKGAFEEVRLTHKEWQTLFKSLGRKVGRHGRYWQVSNPFTNDDAVAGSLADDLADIYRDINPGLKLYKRSPRGAKEAAIWHWRFSLIYHWGQHATGALRALQQLHSEWRLGV